MAQRAYVLAGSWLAGTLVATGVGLGAIAMVGDGLTTDGAPPLSSREVDQALGAGGGGPAPAPTGQATPVALRSFRVAGVGSVVARCVPRGVEALSWSPERGFRSDDVRPGPAAEAVVVFEGSDRDVRVSLRCVDGVPQGRARSVADDRGGDRADGADDDGDDGGESGTGSDDGSGSGSGSVRSGRGPGPSGSDGADQVATPDDRGGDRPDGPDDDPYADDDRDDDPDDRDDD